MKIVCNIFKAKSTVPVKMSTLEALSFLVENNFSKSQYHAVHMNAIKHNVNIYPPYFALKKEKQLCYPHSDSIYITETRAEVSFQALLDKTAERLVESQLLCFQSMVPLGQQNTLHSCLKATLISKWGFDSSTAQSTYGQTFLNEIPESYCEDSMFSTTLAPLNLDINGKVL